jgi:hypothetical protein
MLSDRIFDTSLIATIQAGPRMPKNFVCPARSGTAPVSSSDEAKKFSCGSSRKLGGFLAQNNV